jgi:hypothetical protein
MEEGLWWALVTSTVWAVDAEAYWARLEEVAPLRAQRIIKDIPSIPKTAYQEALDGKVSTGLEVVAGFKAKKAWGVGIVEVPISKYWAALNDDPGKVEWTRLAYVEILSGRRCEPGRRVFQYLSVPMVSDRWWVIDVTTNKPVENASGNRMREMKFAKTKSAVTLPESSQVWADKGLQVDSNIRGWLLIDLDGKNTLVEYYVWSDPGGRLPAGLANTFAAGGIDDTMNTMAQFALKGTGCSTY